MPIYLFENWLQNITFHLFCHDVNNKQLSVNLIYIYNEEMVIVGTIVGDCAN